VYGLYGAAVEMRKEALFVKNRCNPQALGTVHGTVFAATFDFKSCLASGSINPKKTIQPSVFLLCRGRMGYVDNRVKLESKEEKLEGVISS
jgi:hypothetical protein